MRSTERVEEGAITSYEDLGNPDFRGRVCLRTSNNEYNQSWVADRIAKYGEAETEELLESIMANEPKILGSDVDVLEAIAAGDCDVGLTNHYYLARELKDDPDFPVAPAWPEGRRRRAHQRVGRRARQGRRAPRERDPPDGVPHRPARRRRRSWRTASSRPTRTCRRPSTSATGRTSRRTRSTSSRPGRCSRTAVEMMQRVGWE